MLFRSQWQRLVAVGIVGCSVFIGCSDSDESGDWAIDERADTGVESDTGIEPRCELPEPIEPADGVSQTVLLANAGMGAAFGHSQEGSTWQVAKVFGDGRLELGVEHTFHDEMPLELYPSGKRAYLAATEELRVKALDVTRGFEEQAEYVIPRPDDWPDDRPGAVSAAAYAEQSRRHCFSFSSSPVIACLDECDASGSTVDFIDLTDPLGQGAYIDTLFSDADGYLTGVALTESESVVFVLDVATGELVDQDTQVEGVQFVELPYAAPGAKLTRLSDGALIVNTSTGPIGTANEEIAGGLVRLEVGERSGIYELGDYWVTAQDLQGNPADFVMLSDTEAVVVVNEEFGRELRHVEFIDEALHLTALWDQQPVHVCASSDGEHVWLPASEAVYAFPVDDVEQVLQELDAQPSMIPHHCMFAR